MEEPTTLALGPDNYSRCQVVSQLDSCVAAAKASARALARALLPTLSVLSVSVVLKYGTADACGWCSACRSCHCNGGLVGIFPLGFCGGKEGMKMPWREGISLRYRA